MSDQDSTMFDQTGDKKEQVVSTNEQLAALVGEGQKYKTVDALAKGYMDADAFIQQLKAEMVELKAKVASASTIDDVMARLKAEREDGAPNTTVTETTTSELTPAKVAQIVRDTISGAESEREKAANLRKADAEMRKRFGEKATEVFDKEAATPEMKAALVQLASVSPDKFVALFTGGQQSTVNVTDSKTVVNTAVQMGGNDNGRQSDPTTKEYFEALRRKEPTKYYSQAVQLQMNKAAQTNPNHYWNRS